MKNCLLILFFLLPLITSAQNEPLDKEKWSNLKKEVEFQQTTRKANHRKTKEKGQMSAPRTGGSTLNLGPLVQIVIIILFIVFIVMLLYTLLSNVSFKKGRQVLVEDSGAPTSIEENFTKSNLDRWLQYALSQRDFYLVLRIHFLMVLKNLENKGLILWKKDKTNWHYIQELNNHQLQAPFQELVLEFDKVWYGEKDYTDEDLQQKIDRFNSFKNLMGDK